MKKKYTRVCHSEDKLLFLFNIELCLKNKTTDYAQNGDHFWNLAIRTSKLPIDRMYVEGIITGMSIKEIIQKAAQQQNAADDMIIYREVPLQTLIKYASTQKPLSKTTKITQLNEKTIVPIVIGGQQGSSVATLLYEHTGQTLPAEIIAVLQTIKLTDTVNGRQKQHIQELVQHTFKKTKGHVQEFVKDLYCALDIREDVSYNLADKEGVRAYEQSERFRKSGLTKTQLSDARKRAYQVCKRRLLHFVSKGRQT